MPTTGELAVPLLTAAALAVVIRYSKEKTA